MDSAAPRFSAVGSGAALELRGVTRMFGALADAGVNIEMISTSEVRITCIVAEDELEIALRALHDAFELERPESVDAASDVAAAG